MYKFFGGCLLISFLAATVFAQVRTFPYVETFDSASAPSLPPDWATTFHRLPTGDFFSTTTSPRSAPQAAQSTNSLISQSLVSPPFDFSGRIPGTLQFFIARSGTHTAPLLIEVSTDDGVTFSPASADTLLNSGTTSYVRTELQLSPSLRDQPSVRFRWRILGGSGGTAGTLRLDDIVLTTLITNDLSIERLAVNPVDPFRTSFLEISVTVRNRGFVSSSSFEVDLFLRSSGAKGDSTLIASLAGPALVPGDSVSLLFVHNPLPAGTWEISAKGRFLHDERKENDSASLAIHVGVPPFTILINEIMYAPAGDEPEWIELLNTSTDTLDLRGWRISDSNVSTKTLISSAPFLISPNGYAMIAKDSIFFSLRSLPEVPARIINFSPLNNSTPDAVVLYDDRGSIMDSVFYFPDWGGRGGFSLERIDPEDPSNQRSNWGTSIDSTGATPGGRNSIVRFDHDLELVSASGEGTTFAVEIRNAGRIISRDFSVDFFDKTRNDTLLIGTAEFGGSLLPGTSILLRFEWDDAPSGETLVKAEIKSASDQRLQNNARIFRVKKHFPSKEVIINEIMYEPLSGQNEWLELFHRGKNPVDLSGWSFMDRPTVSGNRNSFAMSASARTILPGEFVLIAAESTILNLFHALLHVKHVVILNRTGGFSFGNDGDDIIVKDLLGTVIDSVRYAPRWHHPDVTDVRGRSLERIHPDLDSNDPRNWSTSASAAGGSPAMRNTIFTERIASTASLSFSPNPFSPDGDGFEDFCMIRFSLPHETSVIRLRIYDRYGRLIITLADGDPSGPEGERIWNGLDSVARRARIGPYIALLEALDRSGEILVTAKGVIVVATKL